MLSLKKKVVHSLLNIPDHEIVKHLLYVLQAQKKYDFKFL